MQAEVYRSEGMSRAFKWLRNIKASILGMIKQMWKMIKGD